MIKKLIDDWPRTLIVLYLFAVLWWFSYWFIWEPFQHISQFRHAALFAESIEQKQDFLSQANYIDALRYAFYKFNMSPRMASMVYFLIPIIGFAALMLFLYANKWLSRLIIALVIIGLARNAMHLGTSFEHRGGFEFSSKHDVFEDYFPEYKSTVIRLDGKLPGYGIPLVFVIFTLKQSPFDVTIFIDDESRSTKKMVIETVTVDYANGKQKKFDLNLEKEFEPSEIHIGIGGDKTRVIPTMSLEFKLPAIVKESMSCTVRLEGYFVDIDGKNRPFDKKVDFEYEPTYWYVKTLISQLHD